MCFAAGGGILFDRVGRYWPFILVGVMDVSFAVFCMLMACFGVVRNDILEKKVAARLAGAPE